MTEEQFTTKHEMLLYKGWEEAGYFKPSGDLTKDPYCIMIPPPNVTGSLHMGHAFQDTIMDTLIRYRRMQGHNTLWQVGTDHAGIATQMVVERKIANEENKTKEEYGREKFIERVWDWKQESGGLITEQLRRMGASVDWERERFTMDDGLSNAVQEAFVRLYEDDLIYRGKRLVNWDPKLDTALSDIEVENREEPGHMWYFRYPLADGKSYSNGIDHIVVGTTRPETMLGDTAVAINPDHPDAEQLIGMTIELPLVGRRIPIIADNYADIEKGSGLVKITPAHDFNDYEIGKRNDLPMINVFTPDARIVNAFELYDSKGVAVDDEVQPVPAAYAGLDRFEARKEIVADLEKLGLLEKVEQQIIPFPYGDRSGVIVEPFLTDQWYVRSEPLAAPAIKAVEDGTIEFVPKQYENMYFSWMRNIQDWCISRQLWWGHRIPAWFDDEGNVYVGRSEAEVRAKHDITENTQLKQDDDVLDTWFSSALWTFSTLGWPEETKEMNTFHPTDVLVTAFDIIPFWVARMIMFTLYFIKDENGQPEIPFKTVYVTGLILDESGQKMSKSKGNVVDPLDLIDGIPLEDLVTKRCSNLMQPQMAAKIEKRTRQTYPDGIPAYGTDAVRFTLAALATTGRSINWDMNRLEGYRNFCTKLRNASKYVLMQTEGKDLGFGSEDQLEFSLIDQWIRLKLDMTITQVTKNLDSLRFDLAAQSLYNFIWNEFCDWYLEFSKPVLSDGTAAEQLAARHTLVSVLEQILRLAHPVIPFITETIWQNMGDVLPDTKKGSIMLQPYPEAQMDPELGKDILRSGEWIKEFVSAVRTVRTEFSIPPGKKLNVLFSGENEEDKKILLDNIAPVKFLARLEDISPADKDMDLGKCSSQMVGPIELFFPFSDLVNKDEELARLDRELARLGKELEHVQKKLGNPNFVEKAPEPVIAKEREKLAEVDKVIESIRERRRTVELM